MLMCVCRPYRRLRKIASVAIAAVRTGIRLTVVAVATGVAVPITVIGKNRCSERQQQGADCKRLPHHDIPLARCSDCNLLGQSYFLAGAATNINFD
jgi:hypothetical protein